MIDHEATTNALSEYIGTPCALVRVPARGRRKSSKTLGRDIVTQGDDGYPVTVVSIEALDAFNDWLRERGQHYPDYCVERFRQDSVIQADMKEDGIPFENVARQIHIGDAILERAKLCTRCSMIEVNPRTGEVDYPGLSKLLREYCRGLGYEDPVMSSNYLVRSPGTIMIQEKCIFDM